MSIPGADASATGRWRLPSMTSVNMGCGDESPESSTRARMPTGSSPAVREVNRLIRQVARHDSTVLILGESGTGKEVAARAIHDCSPRANRPFVPVNCGAIPAELLESELFGHEKGAFTGAINARKGRFELADGGTLFLDEIGDMSPPMQVKLLRALQERTFERVGSQVTQRCNVRILAATHRNLEAAIQAGTFREDLYYRLNVFPLEMPSLRERIEDLDLLVADMAQRFATVEGTRVRLSTCAMSALRRYRWPGNVRELQNLLERLAIQCGDRLVQMNDLPARYRPADWQPSESEIAADANELAVEQRRAIAESPVEAVMLIGDVPAELVAAAHAAHTAQAASSSPESAALLALPQDGLDLRAHLDAIERQLIEQALQRSGGIVAHAARLLGLRRTTLVEKLRKFSLVADESYAPES